MSVVFVHSIVAIIRINLTLSPLWSDTSFHIQYCYEWMDDPWSHTHTHYMYQFMQNKHAEKKKQKGRTRKLTLYPECTVELLLLLLAFVALLIPEYLLDIKEDAAPPSGERGETAVIALLRLCCSLSRSVCAVAFSLLSILLVVLPPLVYPPVRPACCWSCDRWNAW